MATTIAADLPAITKKIFDTKLHDVLPSSGTHVFTSGHPTQSEKGKGKSFSSTIRLRYSGGTTPSSGSAVSFNTNLEPLTAELETTTTTRYNHDRLILDDLYKAARKGAGSYVDLAVDTMSGLMRVAMDYNEVNAVSGYYPFAVMLNDAATNCDYSSGTTCNLVVDSAQFIPLAFANKKVDVDVFLWDDSAGTFAKVNSNANVTVVSYSVAMTSGSFVTTLHVEGNATDLGAINTANNATDTADFFELRPVGTCTVVSDALVITDPMGLAKVATLAQGDVYKGYTIPANSILIGTAATGSGAFDLTELENGLLAAKQRGAFASKARPWELLANDAIIADLWQEARSSSSIIRIEAKGNKAAMGVEVEMVMTAAGPVKLVGCEAVRMGRPIAYIDSPNCVRVGSREAKPAYDAMGGGGFTRVPGTNQVEFVVASQVALHHVHPAEVVTWSGNSV